MDETEEETYLNSEDYMDQLETQEENQEVYDQAHVPSKTKPESLFSLFSKVWRAPDSTKVANLNAVELGGLPLAMNVRSSAYLHLLGKTFKHEKFGKFFGDHGEIILASSASKKGWFTELFVSQKKLTTRSSGSGAAGAAGNPQKKWSIFGSHNSPSESPPPQ